MHEVTRHIHDARSVPERGWANGVCSFKNEEFKIVDMLSHEYPVKDIMIGFSAEYVDGEIHLQKEELSRGKWFKLHFP